MIQIIDYGAGNLASIENCLQRLKYQYEIIDKAEQIKEDSKLILAGVGSAKFAMRNLEDSGFKEVLRKVQNPLLGICLGMQLLFSYSEEEDTKCLNIIEGYVKKFPAGVLAPQVGFNQVNIIKQNKLFGSEKSLDCYFVHSYYCEPKDKSLTLAETDYEISFCSAVQQNNFYGVQFHPEKSAEKGEKIILNFLEKC